MKEFIEKFIDKIENEAFAVQLEKGIKHPSTLDAMLEKFTVFRIKEIVNQLAEEYKNQNINHDLMIVESLPSLYPLQPFEVEAIHRVVKCSRNNNGWIPCSERLPEICVPVLVCNAEGRVYIRQINWKSHGKTEIPYWSQNSTGIIAWQPLPDPYIPKQEEQKG